MKNEEEERLKALSRDLSIPYLKNIEDSFDNKTFSLFPLNFLSKLSFLPLYEEDGKVIISTSDPFSIFPEELSSLCGKKVEIVLSRKEEIEEILIHCRRQPFLEEEKIEVEEIEGETDNLLDLANKAPIIKLVNQLIYQALQKRASDIHIQAQEKDLRIRFRIDGLLYDLFKFPMRFQPAVISRIKVLAGLNIAERRLPQDGRTTIKLKNQEIDIRVSILPNFFGESAVLRILERSRFLFSLKSLGFSPGDLDSFSKLIRFEHGIILLTGPTGSGKTTTLYAVLQDINSPASNLITLEDPIEYQIPGVGQIQVNPKIGLTFASGLRSILRHDPDILMVGEIRDLETAEMGIQASLTGHLVFSTLHTNDSVTAPTRLIDMGVEPYLVSSSLLMVMAQRLVRLICPHCRTSYSPDEETLKQLDISKGDLKGGKLYKGKGCKECFNTGYYGRTGIFELFLLDEEDRNLILQKKPATFLKKAALKKGLSTLRQSGKEKVISGLTTMEEVLRVTTAD